MTTIHDVLAKAHHFLPRPEPRPKREEEERLRFCSFRGAVVDAVAVEAGWLPVTKKDLSMVIGLIAPSLLAVPPVV
jgi:hypothetical protein